ncbi:unnamed protein product [Leptidea sinapis]|uniref:Uncharacterized protein n=1 Tax=Leptidea sinapis TaxID=189913 RepID=A0A5E4QAN0_9NEOP|nr:unnamed protein product [Leptidea sinapis]
MARRLGHRQSQSNKFIPNLVLTLIYSDGDKGPFSVYVSKTEPDPASGYAFKILRFAQFLHKNNISSIKEGGIKKLAAIRSQLILFQLKKLTNSKT